MKNYVPHMKPHVSYMKLSCVCIWESYMKNCGSYMKPCYHSWEQACFIYKPMSVSYMKPDGSYMNHRYHMWAHPGFIYKPYFAGSFFQWIVYEACIWQNIVFHIWTKECFIYEPPLFHIWGLVPVYDGLYMKNLVVHIWNQWFHICGIWRGYECRL